MIPTFTHLRWKQFNFTISWLYHLQMFMTTWFHFFLHKIFFYKIYKLYLRYTIWEDLQNPQNMFRVIFIKNALWLFVWSWKIACNFTSLFSFSFNWSWDILLYLKSSSRLYLTIFPKLVTKNGKKNQTIFNPNKVNTNSYLLVADDIKILHQNTSNVL